MSQPNTANLKYPFVVSAIFIPPGAPLDSPVREGSYDDRAMDHGAPNGCWHLRVEDAETANPVVALAEFPLDDGEVRCESISVDREYRRRGIATYLYNLAERLWSQEVTPADNLSDDAKAFWKNRRKRSENPSNAA